jgi:hypothetical protein
VSPQVNGNGVPLGPSLFGQATEAAAVGRDPVDGKGWATGGIAELMDVKDGHTGTVAPD